MVTPHTTLCPSATAQEGALLLGVVGPDKSVRFLPEPEPMTTQLTESVTAIDNPEQHFRFANKCAKSGCNQWQSGRCGVIDLVMSVNQHLEAPVSLPPCAIRAQCRWHKQSGPTACTVCLFIITDSSKTSEERLEYIDANF
ncbi:hypothetical protein [Spirosoma pollinicola]|uniref:Nitrogen fixation protein n=1 Tax=Spirosoma pollinicola TaxID=2057025 RepID=A0A2K8Z4V4_9BACT|nr:hypothetical protein [Spirosoma pollinicola]AUD04844.1 hypothetical protein CWM47_25180 [Spirosoma pollinicola]